MPSAEGEVQAIVDWSHRWNESVGITGALIFTEQHFSQFIEGPAFAVDDLFAKLQRDPRHNDINVIRNRTSGGRRFGGWSLAYSGPEMFLEPQIGSLLTLPRGPALDQCGEDLILLMEAFAKPQRVRGKPQC